MYNHAPEGYICPLCLTSKGIESEKTMAKQADVFYRDDLVFAMVNSKFVGNNPGHVIVVPNDHYENIYDIPLEVAHRIFDVAQKVALALKDIRRCDGVMTQQNNEPASGQHAFHFHFHIFPRFDGDNFAENINNVRLPLPEERAGYAADLRKYFEEMFPQQGNTTS